MAITLVNCDGFEHGVTAVVAAPSGAPASLLNHLYCTQSGSPACDSGTKRTGSYSLKINPAAGTKYAGLASIATAATAATGMAYVYVTTLPAATT